jgi:hypothetical protein
MLTLVLGCVVAGIIILYCLVRLLVRVQNARGCVFCRIRDGSLPAKIVHRDENFMVPSDDRCLPGG